MIHSNVVKLQLYLNNQMQQTNTTCQKMQHALSNHLNNNFSQPMNQIMHGGTQTSCQLYENVPETNSSIDIHMDTANTHESHKMRERD